MASRHKLPLLLSGDDLASLEAFVRERGRTVDQCHEWVQAHGYTLHRSAVGTWKREFDATDKFEAAADVARGFLAAQASDPVGMAQATVTKAQQLVFEGLLKMELDGELNVADLKSISVAVKNTMTSQLDADELRGRQKAAVAEANKLAKAGGSGEAVAAKVRELLGIKEAA